jgi:hypothetical protein
VTAKAAVAMAKSGEMKEARMTANCRMAPRRASLDTRPGGRCDRLPGRVQVAGQFLTITVAPTETRL